MTSPGLQARVAGALYLVSIACGFFAQMFVRAKLLVYADPAAWNNVAEARHLAEARRPA